MFFAMLQEVLPKLLPELGEAYCAAKNAYDVNYLLSRPSCCATSNDALQVLYKVLHM